MSQLVSPSPTYFAFQNLPASSFFPHSRWPGRLKSFPREPVTAFVPDCHRTDPWLRNVQPAIRCFAIRELSFEPILSVKVKRCGKRKERREEQRSSTHNFDRVASWHTQKSLSIVLHVRDGKATPCCILRRKSSISS